MYKLQFLFLILILSVSCIHQKPNEQTKESKYSLYVLPEFKIDSIVDERDHKSYRLIHIGTQVWCADNIQYKTNNKSWQYSSITKGRLYSWKAANEACPNSFLIPSDKDWATLVNFVDSALVKKSSRKLLNELIKNTESLNIGGCHGVSYQSYANIDSHPEYILSIYLNAIGFSTNATGFRLRYLGHDGFTYFWSSTNDKKNDHKWMRFKDMNCGIPRPDGVYNNDNNGLRLKCIKK